jgi:hypothetical protein
MTLLGDISAPHTMTASPTGESVVHAAFVAQESVGDGIRGLPRFAPLSRLPRPDLCPPPPQSAGAQLLVGSSNGAGLFLVHIRSGAVVPLMSKMAPSYLPSTPVSSSCMYVRGVPRPPSPLIPACALTRPPSHLLARMATCKC